MNNEKKNTFNPVEALQDVIRETAQVTQGLRGLMKDIVDEKEGIKEERLKFLEELESKTSQVFKENEQIANRTADKLKKSVPESIHVQVDEIEKQLKDYAKENEKLETQLKEFKSRKNVFLYFFVCSSLLCVVCIGCSLLFYKYSVQSKQETLTEYQEQLEKENKAIVNKSTQVDIGYVNEWIEANPKEGQSLIDYVSKKKKSNE